MSLFTNLKGGMVMSARNIRIFGLFSGVVMLLIGLLVKRSWAKVFWCLFGVIKIAGNLVADDALYEEIEAQITNR